MHVFPPWTCLFSADCLYNSIFQFLIKSIKKPSNGAVLAYAVSTRMKNHFVIDISICYLYFYHPA